MDYYFVNYGIFFITLIITLGAQWYINHCFKKTSKINNERNITGMQAAREILNANGLEDVKVLQVPGSLTDHYDPRNKIVNLSDSIYDKTTISAISVAAHECGHAIQDKTGYTFLRIRKAMVPLVNIANYAGYVSILIGAIFSLLDLIWIGIALEAIILLFQLVTLPVEFDASKRALNQVEELGILDNNELKYGKKMLVSAALTYVAGAATAMLQILRLILIFGGRRDD